MVKTRVHDLAAEFGVPAEQLMGLLKDMNIFVRSHMSALENDQVAAARGALGARKAPQSEKSGAPERAAEGGCQERGAGARRDRGPAHQAAPYRGRGRQGRGPAGSREGRRAAGPRTRAARHAGAGRSQDHHGRFHRERARALFKDLPPAEAEAGESETAAGSAKQLFRDAPTAPPEQRPAASASPSQAAPPSEPSAPARKPFIPPRITRPSRRPQPRTQAGLQQRRAPHGPELRARCPSRAAAAKRVRRASVRRSTRKRCRRTSPARFRA